MSALSLSEWLRRLESQHPTDIELGLDRVSIVASAMGLLGGKTYTFSVAGTNGKGSVVAVLAAALVGAGYSVGVYTSPHLHRFNERIVINGTEAHDQDLIAAFEAVELHRAEVSLTYFEFTTLAALWLFRQRGVDHQILEVGLGGRLDAVNIIDADISIITSIGLDHMDWLGASRDQIAIEKAGIARRDRVCIVAEPDPPATLVAALDKASASGLFVNQDWWVRDGCLTTASQRLIRLPNAQGLLALNEAAALQALEASGVLTLDDALIGRLEQVRVRGRRDRLDCGGVDVVLDVAHNTESVAALRAFLEAYPVTGKTRALFGVMGDKPIRDMLNACGDVFAEWGVIEFEDAPRAVSASDLIDMIGTEQVASSGSLGDVWGAVSERCRVGDRVVIFGSFLTVAEGYTVLANQPLRAESV
ncbi:MAG: Mur ligase family protein [Luminiphilus sp.]|nr:Mur ligase family protein [Luminiphilus sp.]